MAQAVDVYGVPMDLGGSRRGVDMGPSALRIAGVVDELRSLGLEVVDRGNVEVEPMEVVDPGDPRAKYLQPILECCADLAERVAHTVRAGRLPLSLGGDHSIAVGTVSGSHSVHASRGERIGLIWFDAHSDMNTPATSPSGNVHGMPLAMLLGHGPREFFASLGPGAKVRPENCALIGVRSVDPTERDLVRGSGIHAFTMTEIDRLGMGVVAERAIAAASAGTAGIHVSFDLDGLDPKVAPGVGTAVAGGVSYREAHLMMEMVAETGKLIGLDMVELNAVLDERNETARVAVGLIASALGQRIL